MKCSEVPVRSHWVMNHLRVELEYRALEFSVEQPELGVALHHSINCEIRK